MGDMFWDRLKSAAWHVAYRQLPEGSILDKCDTPFVEIPNQWPYNAVMDPFVFEHLGETYIFAELYDYLKGYGVIGYAKWTGKGFSKWKAVIEENYHLSYPFIYSDQSGNVFIIPESYQNKSVYRYRAISFPDKWEKDEILMEDVQYVDTTILETSNSMFAFTYDIGNMPKELLLYKLEKGKFVIDSRRSISHDDAVARSGGRFFIHHGQLIRVSQDCAESYGRAIVFSYVATDFQNQYHERKIATFGLMELWETSKIKGIGVHTYNATKQIEVIDINKKQFSLFSLLFRIKRKILEK